ncbi:MAG TPA: PilX N-terminal domain-containing pilus assembly protein [Thermoanaerobaculia bacterium]|nr:PilX N-terminal domain-containing pilus assembly protein [Thermoanaerobaculia bacterium]
MREPIEANPRRVKRRAEAGSAYIAVLLVLVILTILGLALSFVTQTEMQTGRNERTVNRVFYAADAGVETAIARALVASDHVGRSFFFTDSGQSLAPGTLELGTEVAISDFFPIQEGPCNFCEINNGGGYQGRDYYNVTHAVTIRATRFATVDAGTARKAVAQKTVSTMVDIQPWKTSNAILSKTIENEASLKEISIGMN